METRWSVFGSTGHANGLSSHRRHVDIVGERPADDLRLLVDLLVHKMTVVAFLGEQGSGRVALDPPFDQLVRRVADVSAVATNDNPVALLEIGDAVGERCERERIGAEIHFAFAIANRKRRALARSDEEIVLAFEQIDEGKGATQTFERRVNRVGRRLTLGEFVFDDKGGDLGIRLGHERVALRRKFLSQCLEVLNNPVVDDREPTRGMRMGVGLGWLAMRRPARVADPDSARERRGGKLGLEVCELALGTPAFELTVLKRRDTG